MNKFFVYGLYSNDKLFYIGITINKKQRLCEHKRKYGKSIQFEVLDEYFGSEDAALALETFWIKKYNDLGVELVNTYKVSAQRKTRSYKCSDEIYLKAMDRAKKEGTTVAELIEKWVIMYGQSTSFIVFSNKELEYSIKDHNKQL